MSTTAGVWSETTLQNIRTEAAGLMDSRIGLQYKPNSIETINYIKSLQTANFTPLEGKKEATVELEWINACGISVTDNTGCTYDSTELSSNTETKTLSKERKAGFVIDGASFKSNDFNFEQALAKGMLRADAKLVDDIAAYGVAQLNTFAGANQLSGAGEKFTNSGTTIEMPAAYWNSSAIATLMRTGAYNKFSNPYALSGSLMHEAALNANWDGGNADGKGGTARFSEFPLMFDEVNVDTVNGSDKMLYLASMGSIALASRTDNDDSIKEYTWGRTFRMQSNFVPGLYYDVIAKDECSDDVNKLTVKLIARYDIFLNPTGCEEGNTGVLKFKCV